MASEGPAPVAFVDDREAALVETTLELLSFDTANPPGDTTAVVDTTTEALAANAEIYTRLPYELADRT